MSLYESFQQYLARRLFSKNHQQASHQANHQDSPQIPISLAVAFSGGVDSHVLLHLCYQLSTQYPDIRLKALHVNHGISTNADKWQQHCRQICEQYQIEFHSRSLHVKKMPRTSLEAEARNARYAALLEMAAPNDVLLLGQHQQDQVETFLLQLKRGSGPKGLSAMAESGIIYGNEFGGTGSMSYLRPLLNTNKAQILNYAEQHQLSWQDDESNDDTGFDRNFLRHQVIPLLNERWSAFDESVSRSARLIADQQALIEETAQQYLQDCLQPDHSLDLEQLGTLSLNWQKQVIRIWIATFSKSGIPDISAATNLRGPALPSEKVLHQVIHHLIPAKADGTPKVKSGAWQYRRFQNSLYLVPEYHSVKAFEHSWQGEPVIALPADDLGRIHLSVEKPEGVEASNIMLPSSTEHKVTIRFSGYGSSFKPAGELMSKPLKQWFKQWNIPPWERERMPLLFVGEQLAAVGNIIASQFFSSEQPLKDEETHSSEGKQSIWWAWEHPKLG